MASIPLIRDAVPPSAGPIQGVPGLQGFFTEVAEVR